nr:hypothetical protein [uncultured Campylobacter sp.]
MRYFDFLNGKDKETFEMQVLRVKTAFDLEIRETEHLIKLAKLEKELYLARKELEKVKGNENVLWNVNS